MHTQTQTHTHRHTDTQTHTHTHAYVLHTLGNILHVLLAYRVVMVVGAGRGPLVTATLKAATEARRIVRVYAVEKNANAIVT